LNSTFHSLGGASTTVIVDTIHSLSLRLGSMHDWIGRVRETNVPYAIFGAAQKTLWRAAHSIGGSIGEVTNPVGG
jgi:hypothetical protein